MKGTGGRVKPTGLRTLAFCALAFGGLLLGFQMIRFGIDYWFDFKNEWYFWRAYHMTMTTQSSIHISESVWSQPTNGSLFCFVITAPLHHKKRVPAVSRTWLKRCDHGEIFTSSQKGLDENIPYRTLFQHLDDSYDALFWKSKLAIQYSYMQISPEFDWYMKADDDSYVIVENLKAFLATLDPSQPYYLGFRLRPHVDHGYNSGGAGYLLSRKAVEIFSTQLFTNSSICSFNIYEDVGIGKCLEEVNVYPHDTRDSEGRQMFNLFTPGKMIRQADLEAEGQEKWFYDGYLNAGFKAISPDSISFHHVSPDMMDTFEAALYHIRVRQK